MRATICDKCGRRCDERHWELKVRASSSTMDSNSVDLCAVCAFALTSLVPGELQVLLPSKERADTVASKDPAKPGC